jgi:arylsulfatase A-like enzyme
MSKNSIPGVAMKKLGLVILILITQALPQRGAQAAQGTATRPNILFILADDLGAEASELYPALYNRDVASGHGQVTTPTLSALAARGIVFDNVWASPLCSPTRGTLLSGLYGHNTGVTMVGNTLPGTTTSIFELLGDSARLPPYKMAVFGKWHLGDASGVDHVVKQTGVPLFKGFLLGSIQNYYSWTLDSSTAPSANTTVYSTTALTDFAIDFIRNQNRNQPWFVYLPYNAPHGTAPNNGFQVPPANLFRVSVEPRPAGDPKIYNNDIPVYQAVIQALDTEIGRLFRAMDQAGQLDNTVIIFMGDNGTPAPVKDTAASRIRGSKGSVYEGGVRVPLVVTGPAVKRTGRDSHLVSSADLYATIAQLAGVPLTNNSIYNSYGIVPRLGSNPVTTGRKYSFTELCANTGAGNKQFAIRDQKYKLMYSGTAWEMFDLEADPWEKTNVYSDASHPKARAALLEELRALRMKSATNGCFVDIPAQ